MTLFATRRIGVGSGVFLAMTVKKRTASNFVRRTLCARALTDKKLKRAQ